EIARAILAARRFNGSAGRGLVFPTTSGRAQLNYSNTANRIAAKAGIEGFGWHVCRHTTRTLLDRLGIEPHLKLHYLGHTERGMARVYSHHRYLEELRIVTEKLAALLTRIAQAQPSTDHPQAGIHLTVETCDAEAGTLTG